MKPRDEGKVALERSRHLVHHEIGVRDQSDEQAFEMECSHLTKTRFKLVVTVHLLLIQKDSILLLRRYNTGYADGQYSVVAGHLDGNEEVKAAMIREAREEAGIEIAVDQLQVVGVMHRRSSDERIDFFLRATTWAKEIVNKEPHKCDELGWYPLHALPHNTVPYVRAAIANYLQGKWFDSFGWEEQLVRTP